MSPVGSDTMIGSTTESTIRSRRLRSARRRFRDVQPPVVLFELAPRLTQVCHVAQHRHQRAVFLELLHRRGQEFEQQIRAVVRIDQHQLARRCPRVRSIARLAGADEKNMLLRATARRRPFTLVVARREQLLRRGGVADDQLAGRVGQQDRIRVTALMML